MRAAVHAAAEHGLQGSDELPMPGPQAAVISSSQLLLLETSNHVCPLSYGSKQIIIGT